MTHPVDSVELDLHVTATHLFPRGQSPTKVGFVLAIALSVAAHVTAIAFAEHIAAR